MYARQSSKTKAIVILLVVFPALLGSCSLWAQETSLARQQSQPGGPTIATPQTLNLVEQAGLRRAVGIEIYIGAQIQAAISDPKTIYELVNALDADLVMTPRVSCSGYYTIFFNLDDGNRQAFTLACGPQDPSFLRGGQEFWGNRDLDVPLEFARLLLEQIPPSPASSPQAELPVVAWYGYVLSAPSGSGFDDYLVTLPQGMAEVGLTGCDPAIEAQIVALRDKQMPGKHAHFWGALTCGVTDYGSCQIRVERLHVDGPGSLPSPEPVDGLEGTIHSLPSDQPRSGGDDYLQLGGPYPVQYGLHGADEALQAQIVALRDSGVSVRLWGQMTCGIPDAGGCQILVQRVQ